MGFESAIYSGLSRQFIVRRLTPFTDYQFVLEVCTGVNLCTLSAIQIFQTSETIPEEQNAPIVNFANATAITVTWIKPTRPNGKILNYMVLRKVISKLYSYQVFFHFILNLK